MVPTDSMLYREFEALLIEQKEDDISCISGTIAELSTEDFTCVYFPKNLDDLELYEDADEKYAESSQAKAQELYDRILAEGTVVTELPTP